MSEPVPGKVAMAYIHPAEVACVFHESVKDLLVYDVSHERRLFNGGGILSAFSSANVSQGRNGLVKRFLDETPAEWLWMIDADMQFAPDTLEKLLAFAQPVRPSEDEIRAAADSGEPVKWSPIVGGLCFSVDVGKLHPTLFMLTEDDEHGLHTRRFDTYPEDSMFLVAATGAACLLIHRSVLESVRDADYNKAYPWFQETQLGDAPVGEDCTFCFRAGKLGYPIWVHTGIRIGHQKPFVADHDGYTEQVGDPHVRLG